jgi:hypothetical protein
MGEEGVGGCCLFMQGGELIDAKNKKIKKCRGLRWLCYDTSHATTNQKHVGTMEQVYESRCSQGGVRRGDNSIILGGVRS